MRPPPARHRSGSTVDGEPVAVVARIQRAGVAFDEEPQALLARSITPDVGANPRRLPLLVGEAEVDSASLRQLVSGQPRLMRRSMSAVVSPVQPDGVRACTRTTQHALPGGRYGRVSGLVLCPRLMKRSNDREKLHHAAKKWMERIWRRL